jgi:hypothetical protein
VHIRDANAGVETTSDNVAQSIINHEIEHYIRVLTMKATEPRSDELLRGHARGIYAQRARGSISEHCEVSILCPGSIRIGFGIESAQRPISQLRCRMIDVGPNKIA